MRPDCVTVPTTERGVDGISRTSDWAGRHDMAPGGVLGNSGTY
jgi:hypothetical protein